LYDAGQPLLDEAVGAFSDLMPQSLSAQAVSPRPLTVVRDGEDTVLIGGPWRPPFPWPLPPVDKPLFITIKRPSPECTPPSRCYPQARMAFLRQAPQGGYELEWFGAPGTPSVRVPAQVEAQGNLEGVDREKIIVQFSINPIEKEIDIIIIIGKDASNPARMHIVSSLPPDTLPGRPLNRTLDAETYEARFREICCGRPKPFPPSWPPVWLQREDVVAVAVLYNNPKLQGSGPIEELVGENLGFLYLRKKPWPSPGPTTDCGPGNVWCPPNTDPFLNLRLVRNPDGGYAVQLTKLGDPNQVIATLPAQVSANDEGTRGVGIEDDIASPNTPTLELRWPRIRIRLII
ncbi:MAG: hypothetical protein RMI80_09685, partial [Meiothermus sp.]|uniref:hypothetical protein n=1 Tax=Meiothermus sp. TaxID=1955249 RepID=UPI00298F3ACC